MNSASFSVTNVDRRTGQSRSGDETMFRFLSKGTQKLCRRDHILWNQQLVVSRSTVFNTETAQIHTESAQIHTETASAPLDPL
jgi:hypothetical protein